MVRFESAAPRRPTPLDEETDYADIRQLRAAIDAFITAYNPEAAPFEWRNVEVFPNRLKQNYSDSRD